MAVVRSVRNLASGIRNKQEQTYKSHVHQVSPQTVGVGIDLFAEYCFIYRRIQMFVADKNCLQYQSGTSEYM